MSLRDVERAITAEAQVVLCNPKLRLKDLQEWRTSELKGEREDEVVVHLPEIGAWAAYKRTCDRRPAP